MDIQQLIESGANVQITVTANDLQEFARTIVATTLERTKTEEKERLIPRKKVCEKIPAATLNYWRLNGFLVPVYIGAKAFYKQSELQARNIVIE